MVATPHKNPGTSAVLSLLIPGIGQFYNGDFWRGLFWLIVTPGLWIGSGGLLGWICHVIAAITAYKRAERFNRLAVLMMLISLLGGPGVFADQIVAGSHWLDRPLTGWNQSAELPKAPFGAESREALMKRCRLTLLQSTPAERALGSAGWIPFLNFDQRLVRDDVEIVDGMTAADGMCRPAEYNVFVFVAGRFAGTLSPALMTSRTDGSSGTVRILPTGELSSDFARYSSADPLCCPSSHVVVQYRVDRSTPRPIVVPTEIRTRP